MRFILLASAFAFPTTVFAAGGGEESAPKPASCKNGKVWDKKKKRCIDASHSSVQDMYETVRSLSYEGRYTEAQNILAEMPVDDDRTLTYLGFTNRKMGNRDAAMTYYARALVVNPANILARSYMGQGLVEEGNVKAAIAQLREIRAHGGAGTWAEASLKTAIATGRTHNY